MEEKFVHEWISPFIHDYLDTFRRNGRHVRGTIKHSLTGAVETIDCIGARVASVRYFLPFRCRVGVNWQSEKRLSLEGPVMHRRATEARGERDDPPHSPSHGAPKSKRKNTRRRWTVSRDRTHGRQKGRATEDERRGEGEDDEKRKIEGRRLNERQRRKLRHKAWRVAMDSIRLGNTESRG